MNNLEIRKAAYKLYWSHSTDVSEYDEKDKQAILEDLSLIKHNEDEANTIVDRRLMGELKHERWFKHGL